MSNYEPTNQTTKDESNAEGMNEFQHGSGSQTQANKGSQQTSISSGDRDSNSIQDTTDSYEGKRPILPMLSDEEILARVLNDQSLSAKLRESFEQDTLSIIILIKNNL